MNQSNEEIPIISENKTFNKICRIQKLIKKESAMKQICKY